MTTRWLFSPKGEAPCYQDGDFIYSKDGQTLFSVSNGWWFSIKTGKTEYYVHDGWVYSQDGTARYYFFG
jgi:hypothetical protein